MTFTARENSATAAKQQAVLVILKLIYDQIFALSKQTLYVPIESTAKQLQDYYRAILTKSLKWRTFFLLKLSLLVSFLLFGVTYS